MATLLSETTQYPKNEKVMAARDLPGVPEGTPGRVKVVNGMTWARYWIQFDNGEWLGQVDHGDLVRAKDWAAHQAGTLAAAAVDDEHDPDESPDSGGGGATSGDGVEVNGAVVPGYLLERAKQARERLGA